VDTIYWYIDNAPGDAALTAAELEGKWEELTEANKPSVQTNQKFTLYALVKDNVGNESPIYYDNIVLYSDGSAGTTSVNAERFAAMAKDVSVALHGNTVADIKLLDTSEPGIDGDTLPYTLTSTDYAVDVSNGMITLSGAFLAKLKLGSHTFTVSYSPQGEPYVASTGTDINDEPLTTTFSVNVVPVIGQIGSVGTASALHFGDSLGSSHFAGWRFVGVNGDELAGTLSWVDGTIIPGAAGSESDGFGGSVAESGRFLAGALFTPSDANYVPMPFDVEVVVAADAQAWDALAEVFNEIKGIVPVLVASVSENYDAEALQALKDAFDQATALVAAGDASQNAALQLNTQLQETLLALSHDHPVKENSALEPLTGSGEGIRVRVKGAFVSTAKVTIDNITLYSATTDAGLSGEDVPLLLAGEQVGVLSEGSAIVTLFPVFVDTLPNGNHTIGISFADAYGSGTAEIAFTIARPPAPESPEVPETPETPETPTAPEAPTGGTYSNVNALETVLLLVGISLTNLLHHKRKRDM
jgi:hypothetical protein